MNLAGYSTSSLQAVEKIPRFSVTDNVYLQECEDKRLETEGDLDLNDTFKTGMYSDFQSYTRPSIFDYSNIQWFCSSPCSLKDNVFAMEEVDLQESIPIILGSREIKALPSRSSTALDLHCNKCLANISIMSNHSALETESTIEQPTLLADSSPTLTEQ